MEKSPAIKTEQFYTGDERIPVSFQSKRHLISVDFPAVVQNIDKAFDTFNGVHGLEKALKDDNKRLALHWRKDDIYCKPVYGDRVATNNLLLRVRRRKKKQQDESSETVKYEYSVAVEGFILTTYEFTAMVDYQYLPVERKEDGTYKNLLPSLSLTGMTSREEFLNRDVPLFMPPMIFSRIDAPVEYLYRPDKILNRTVQRELEHLPPNLIGTGRMKRTIYTIFKTFTEDIPLAPPKEANVLQVKLRNTNLMELISKLFEERPIWSKNGLRFRLPMKYLPRLKYALPLVAYYYTNGPWRTLWVKFGYDPRVRKDAKQYQVLDFRLRQRSAADRLEIGGKRSTFTYNLPTLKSRSQMKIPRINTSTLLPKANGSEDDHCLKSNLFSFTPGVLPPYRQVFYQFCDIHEDEIQTLLHINDGREISCSEKEGWLSVDIHEKSREILFKQVDKMLGRELVSIPDPGTRRGRRIVSKIHGLLDVPEDSDSEAEPAVVEEQNEEEEDDGEEDIEVDEIASEMMDIA